MRLSRSLGFSLLSVAAATALAIGVAALWRAHRGLEQARENTAAAHRIAFTLGPLKLAPNPGFEPVASPADLHTAAGLDGHIVLGGPGELIVFTAGGERETTLRAGLELPPSALGPLLVARPPAETRPQLLAATAGAGLLLLGGDPTHPAVRQLLPADPAQRDITAVASLPGGDLLLGTRRGGLLRFDGARLELFRPEYRNAAITALLTVGDEVWAGTQDDGLLHTHGGVTDRFDDNATGETAATPSHRDLPDAHIESLAAGPDGHVFAGTPVGVEEFDAAGRPLRRLAEGVFAHTLSADGRFLFIGTLEEGTLTIALGTPQRPDPARLTALSQPNGTGSIEAFTRLPGEAFPLAVHPDGLYRRAAGGTWALALNPGGAGMTARNVAALLPAPDGCLWVGYFDRGLDLLDVSAGQGASAGPARHIEDDHLFCINRLALDPARHTVAVATANGLVLLDAAGRPRQVLGRRDGLLSEHVSDVSFSGDRMTVATTAGLTFLSPTGAESLYAFQGLVNNHVYTLAASDGGNTPGELVAGTLGGLSLLEGNVVRANLTAGNSGLKHNWITALASLPASDGGGYLVGSYGAGVMRLTRDGRVEALPGATRSMIVNTNALLVTPDHVLAGTLSDGLWSENRRTGRWTQVTGGLPSLNVTAFALRGSDVYVGTENGLARIVEGRLP